MKKLYHIILATVLLFPFGCSTDFLKEVNPVQKTGETFFAGDADAQAAAPWLIWLHRHAISG